MSINRNVYYGEVERRLADGLLRMEDFKVQFTVVFPDGSKRCVEAEVRPGRIAFEVGHEIDYYSRPVDLASPIGVVPALRLLATPDPTIEATPTITLTWKDHPDNG